MIRIPRDLIRHLEWTPGGEQPPAHTPPQTMPSPVVPSSLSIENLTDRYVISPIVYRDGLYQVSLSKKLLDNGAERVQEDWVSYLAPTEWRLASGPLAMALYTSLYMERQGTHKATISKIQRMLRKDHRDEWMMTGTRIKYMPKGLDEVIHEYGTPEAYSVNLKMVGPDEWVTPTSGFEDSIEALLGTRDLALVQQVSSWASGKKPYLWRVNERPKKLDERALVLGVDDSGWFDINANSNGGRPARGVAVQKISP